MRARVKLKALFAAVAVAAGIGLAVPSQASAVESADAPIVVSASDAQAAGGFLTCSGNTPLPAESNSYANACLSLYEGSITASGNIFFESPTPAQWTTCVYEVWLVQVNIDGTETLLGNYPDGGDCLTAAQGGSTVGGPAPSVQAPTSALGYKSKVFLAAVHNGQTMFQWAAETPTVVVWA